MIVDLIGGQTSVHFMIRFSNQAHHHHRVEFQMFVGEAILRFGMLGVENRRCCTGQDTFDGGTRGATGLSTIPGCLSLLKSTPASLFCRRDQREREREDQRTVLIIFLPHRAIVDLVDSMQNVVLENERRDYLPQCQKNNNNNKRRVTVPDSHQSASSSR